MFIAPRWRKVLRDLWTNKTRTCLVVLSIAVGVFAIGTVVGSRAMIDGELRSTYAATNPSNARVFILNVDDEFVDAVQRMDEIRDAEGLYTIGARVKIGPAESDAADAQWRDITLEVRRDYDDVRVNTFSPELGEYPPPKRGMVVERGAVKTFGVDLGEKVTLEMPNGKKRDIVLAGAVHDLDKPSPIFTTRLFGYINFDTLEWLGYPRAYNQIAFVAAERNQDEQHIRDIVKEITERVERAGGRGFGSRVRLEHSALEQAQAMMVILTAIGSLSLLLACFLVVNTMLAILTQQVRQIGVMKTVGARTGQVTRMYLGQVAIFAFLSLCVALPLGALGAYGLSLYAATMLNYNTRFLITPESLAAEAVVGLVVPLAATIAPVFSGSRVTVRDAISSYGVSGVSLKSRLPQLSLALAGVFPRPLLLSLRNTFRRKTRLSLTLFTLTLAGAMFVGVLNVRASLGAAVEEAFGYWRYDLGLSFQRLQPIDKLIAEAKVQPDVKDAEVWLNASTVRIRPDGNESKGYPILGIPSDSTMIAPSMVEGRWFKVEDANVVVATASVLREDGDLRVGDDITLKLDGRDMVWRVIGIARTIGDQGRLYAPYGALSQAVHAAGRGTTLQVVTGVGDSSAQSAKVAQLKEHFDKMNMRVGSTVAIAFQKASSVSQINVLVVFMLLMALLLAVVGGLGLTGTMSINVVERQREIGVMRAIGASTPALTQIFVVEAVLIGAMSWLAGSLFAIPLGKIMSDGVGQAILQAPLSYVIAPEGIVAWLALIVVIAALAALLPAWRATRITVREVLAYE